jgi:hypothetical protein
MEPNPGDAGGSGGLVPVSRLTWTSLERWVPEGRH